MEAILGRYWVDVGLDVGIGLGSIWGVHARTDIYCHTHTHTHLFAYTRIRIYAYTHRCIHSYTQIPIYTCFTHVI